MNFKKIFIIILTFILTFSFITAYAEDIKVPFLLYHSVDDNYDLNGDMLLHISTQNFKEHMQILNDYGYCTISLDEYYDYVKNNGSLPPNPIVICFDDGYESNYLNAYPILKEFGMKATIFVIASRMGDRNVLFPHFGWQEAREMIDSGFIDIESHSLTHPDFSTIDYLDTVKEMRMSKYLIETNLNRQCNYLAYPYGITNNYCTSAAIAAGYKMMCIVGNDDINRVDSDITDLHRLNVSGDMNANTLIEYINMFLN